MLIKTILQTPKQTLLLREQILISTKQKYIITASTPKLFWKKYLFSSQSIRMSGNSINLDCKKIKKSDFYNNKNKKIFNIDVLMLIKY